MTSSFVGERIYNSYSIGADGRSANSNKEYSIEKMKDDSFQRNAYEKFKPNKYKITSKLDLYSHMNFLYSMFYFNNDNNYYVEKSTSKVNDDFSLTINNKEYIILIEKKINISDSEQKRYNKVLNDLMPIIKKHKKKIIAYSIEEQIFFINELLKNATIAIDNNEKVQKAIMSTDKQKDPKEFEYSFNSLNGIKISLMNAFKKEGILISTKSKFDIVEKVKTQTLPSIILVEKGSNLNTFSHIPYLNKTWLMIT